MAKPDVKKFLEDPAFEEDRQLFGAFIEAHLTKKAAEAATKKAPENIFDRMFGVGKSEDDRPLLSRIFDPKA